MDTIPDNIVLRILQYTIRGRKADHGAFAGIGKRCGSFFSHCSVVWACAVYLPQFVRDSQQRLDLQIGQALG